MPILTHFMPDPERLAVLKDCIDSYGVGDDESAEWPNNILSRQTIVYSNGTIARASESVTFSVDSNELDLCVRLAHEAAKIMEGEEVGLGSESSAGFSAFWICTNTESIATKINEPLVRTYFGDTIFPPATIEIEPTTENSPTFSYIREGAEELSEDDPENTDDYETTVNKWRRLFQWFNEQTDFQDTAYISIGDTRELWYLPRDKYPPGTEMTPCVLPHLVLGLTQNGSMCGLFGFIVQT